MGSGDLDWINVCMLPTLPLTVDTLRLLLDEPSGGQFVDLRDPWEFEAEHVPGFVNVPLPDLFNWKQVADKSKPVILFCKNGKKAHIAADVLRHSGFAEVFVVAGGVLSWKVQCFPMAKA